MNKTHSTQTLLANRAAILANLTSALLAVQASDSPATEGLRLIRDELLSLSEDIRALETKDTLQDLVDEINRECAQLCVC